MSIRYAVWIEIELQDEDNDVFETQDTPFGSTETFDTYEDAVAFAQRLNDAASEVKDS